jgi:hypothetical protein
MFLNCVIIVLTYSWSWALLEEPLTVHLLKNFPAFYGTLKVQYRVHKSPPLIPILISPQFYNNNWINSSLNFNVDLIMFCYICIKNFDC